MTTPLRWWRHHTGTWHARDTRLPYRRSLCGLVEQPSDVGDRGWPRGRPCKTCKARRPSENAPRPVPHRPDARLCACRPCRDGRRAGCERYVQRLRQRLDGAVPAEVLEWDGASAHVREAEAALGACLLAWELSGEPRSLLRADLRALERQYFTAWREAERAYDLLGGPRGR